MQESLLLFIYSVLGGSTPISGNPPAENLTLTPRGDDPGFLTPIETPNPLCVN